MGFSLDDYIREKSGGSVRQANSIGATGKGGFSLDRYIEGMRSPAPDLNTWFQDSSSTLDSIAKQAEGWKNTYITPSEIDTSVNQSTKSINDIIRTGLGLHKRFSENKSVYDAIYGEGSSDDTIENINGVIQQLEKMRLGLSQERDFRNSLEGEKAFQDYLIASGDEAAAKSVMSGLEKSKAENEKKLAELRAQLEKTGDKWYTKTLSSLLSDRKPIQDQIKELEARQKELQDQYSRYYYTTENRDKLKAIESDPESGALYDAANVLRSDMEKVSAVGDEALYHKGDPEVSAYKEYLKDKYGLTEDAIQNYVSGGSGYRYSKNGYGNLWQLYEELEKQLTDTKGRLAENGYDYDRMTGYEQSLVDAEEYRKKQKEWEQYATKHPIASSISSVIMSPFQGLDYLRLGIENVGKNNVNDPENYVPLNVYDMDATNYVSAIRGTVSKNIEKNTDWNLFGQNVASFLYQTGMSVADSAAQIAAFGNGAVFLMGASAASNQAKNVIERGGSNSQAFWGGLAAGAAEALFEKISVDSLLKPKSITGWKSLLKETVKQAGVEASEEMLTEIANILSDSAIMGESSDFSVSVKAYQEQGLSESEAKKKAFLECIGQVAWAGAGGALSGGIMGGAAGSLNIANQGVNNRNVGNQVMRSGLTDETIDDGLRLDTDDPLYKLAEKLAERQNQGKPLSPKKVGQLETGLEAKTLDRLESLRGQMARTLSGDTQNGDETVPLGTVYTKSKTSPNGPSNAQDGHSANADVQTNVPYTVNVEAAKPLDAQARMGNSAVTVQGVESVQDGDVTVALSDGTKVPLYDVEIADPQIRQLYDTAAKYDTNTAKAFVSGFDGSLPISTYQSAFDYFVTQAKHGVSMDEAMQHAGLAGQMMSPVSRQTAYFAGENLQSSGSRGNMGAENVATGGADNENSHRGYHRVRADQGLSRDQAPDRSGGDSRDRGISELGEAESGNPGKGESVLRRTQSPKRAVGQDQGVPREFLGKPLGRGKSDRTGRTNPQGNRAPVNGRVEEQAGKQGAARKNAARIERTAIETPGGKAEFEAVRKDALTEKQRKETAIASEYGRGLYHVPKGSLMTLDGKQRIMKAIAFVAPGTHTIFCRDGTNKDFIHHELFHDFLSDQRPMEKRLMNDVLTEVNLQSAAYDFYRTSCESVYDSISIDDIIEEITCDLCEYAMSGSETMYNRLNGLFEGDTLETLAEQAREVFEANREATQSGEKSVKPEMRFYMEDTAEEVKDLIAVHNLSADKLESAFGLGGFPMPSIAVTKADMGHEKFGDISLIFDKETINPADRRNKVYSGDAWTPSFPTVEYKISDKKVSNIRRRIDKLVDSDIQREFRLALDPDNMDDMVNRRGGDAVEAYQGNDALRLAFLRDEGIAFEASTNPKTYSHDAEAIELLIEQVPDAVDAMENYAGYDEIMQYEPKVRGVLNSYYQSKIGESIFDKELGFRELDAALRDAVNIRKEGVPEVVDRYDTRDGLNELFEEHPEYEAKYRDWLENLFDGVVEKKGIRNSKDLFTPSGNRRSFEALHDEYTLDNIVKSMKGDAEKGGALFHSASTVAAASTREYGSISEINQDKGRLSRMTEDEQEAVKKGFEDRLSDIVSRMTSEIKGGNIFSHISNATEAITEALAKRKTASGIKKDLKSWGQFTVTDEIVSDILSLSEDMANAPTTYFEAKPQRAVGFEEVKAAVVPDTLNEDLKTQLEAAGIKTVEYKAGDDADRVRALNEAPELRFFLEDISPVDVDLLTEENQALREQVETLRGEFQLTKGHKVKPASIGKLADTILKETSSSYDKGTLVKNLDALFSYIANDPDANFDEAMDVSVEIANSVLRESSALDSTLYEKYRDMREYFRKTAISLDEDIRAGMDYERFRKEHFGGFRLTNDGTSLDSLWPEISGRWPEFFSPDTPIQDQPQVVADALRTVRPSYVNPYGMDATEAAYDLAMRVYEEYFNLPEIHTFADKKKAELTQLRAKYENRIQAIRKGYKAKEQALVQEQRQKRKDLKDENRLRLAAQMEKVREQRKAAADKRRESALVRRYKPRIIRDTMELGRWLTHPTDKKHVPEPFRKAVAEFVNTIDFSSDRLNSKGKPTMRTMAMQKLFNQMNTILKSESGTFEEAQAIFDGADPDLIPNMADLIQNAERVRIEDMTGTQLGELAHVVAALKSMLTNANTLISGERTRAAEQVAKGIHMDLMGQEAKEYTGLLGLGKRLVNYDMMDAPSYFEELGETAYREIYKPLRRGFDRKIQNTTEAVAYMQRLLKGIDTDTWSGPKAEKHTFKVRGGTVSLTTAQIMSLYELSKRDQARGHILGGGIRPSDTVKKMRIDKTFRPVTLTAQDLKEIVGTLTPEQRAVADGIADFFKVTAEWGNEVSMKLYGYRKFTEQNYFPIVSDKNYLTTMQGDLKRPDAVLKNLGMTKSTVAGANNPIMVEDIFDVFTRQADQMGSYNAFVVPLSDLSKVFNFKASEPGGEVQGSIKESLERALGHDAVAYWNKLVEDINGVSKQTPPTIGDKLLSNMKAAAVGANLRVIIQQPTAYLRAAALIDPKYLAKGLATKSDIDEMNEYAPIAYWKDLGFFEMDTARGMKDILMGKKGLRDIAMKPAGWADTKTWGKLWNAVKAEIRDTTDFKPGTVEFLEAAGERFSEIIDRTQVVDSVLHRSQMMRSKNFINKTVTSFMSEPTKAYNMLRSAVRDVQKNGWKKGRGRLVRVTVAHTATSILTALLAALVDAVRDDDEEKKWWEKYLSAVGENTLDNLSPLNMLPYLKDVASLLSGYNLTRQEMAGLTDVVNAGRAWMSYFQGDSKYSVAWLIKNSAASISKLTGIPVAAATRDLEALVGGSIRTLGDFGVPTARLEYILDTFYYPVNSKNASRYAGRAYDAYRENNPKLAKDILEAMEKGGISEEKIVYYMRKNLRERDDRIAEAGRAKLDGNMSAYARIVGEIRNDGFDREWVVGAVDGWVSKLESAAKEKADGKTKELKESLEEITDGGADQEWAEDAVNRLADSQKKRPANDADDEEEYEGLFEGSDVVMALEAGNTKEAKAVIQEMTDNGKEESSIRSAVTRYYKPIYQDLYKRKDEAGMRKLRETLVGLGIGYKSGDFTRWIQDMEK